MQREESGKGTRSGRNLCAKMKVIFNVYFPVGLALRPFQSSFLAGSAEDSLTLCRCECLVNITITAELVIMA